jgi:hypothetical protein
VIQIIDELVKRKIRFTAINETIHLEGKQDLQTKVTIRLVRAFCRSRTRSHLRTEQQEEEIHPLAKTGLESVDSPRLLGCRARPFTTSSKRGG